MIYCVAATAKNVRIYESVIQLLIEHLLKQTKEGCAVIVLFLREKQALYHSIDEADVPQTMLRFAHVSETNKLFSLQQNDYSKVRVLHRLE